jgi:hypothetical protein
MNKLNLHMDQHPGMREFGPQYSGEKQVFYFIAKICTLQTQALHRSEKQARAQAQV